MSKWANDSVLDALLSKVATGDIMTICSAQPADRTEAVTTYALADVAMTPGGGAGDYTLADGDTSGRKVTMSQKADIPIDADGTANHVAICDATDLLYVTTCTPQALTSGGTVTVPAWKIEVADPA